MLANDGKERLEISAVTNGVINRNSLRLAWGRGYTT